MQRFTRMTSRGTRYAAVLASAAALFLSACTAPASRVTPAERAPELSTLRRVDVSWLERVTFGLDSQAVGDYRRLGRERYLEQQLRPPAEDLAAPIAAQVKVLENSNIDAAATLKSLHERRTALNALPEGAEKEQARKALNDEGNRLAYQAIRLQLLRAMYSPAQLREQMVWFWLNHFSVYQYKTDLRWLVGDYEEHAIRPYALGRFRDLVLATLEHPAMLQYLDNSQNAVGHVNENYARELMELHTLGVDGGYSQQDVQQLARVLTGVGVNAGAAPHLKPEWQALYVRRGAFEFNPARHDFAPKVLLGHSVAGRGFAEVEQAVDPHRAAAGLRALHLARSSPPTSSAMHRRRVWSTRMAETFQHTDGDIAATLRTLFLSPEFSARRAAASSRTRCATWSRRCASRTTAARSPTAARCSIGSTPSVKRPSVDRRRMVIRSRRLSWQSPGQMSRASRSRARSAPATSHLFDPEDGGPPPSHGLSAALEPSVLRGHRTVPRRQLRARTRAGELAAGMEYLFAGLAGVQL